MVILPTPVIGTELPDFTLPTLDGENISVSDYRGKRLVIFMWASW